MKETKRWLKIIKFKDGSWSEYFEPDIKDNDYNKFSAVTPISNYPTTATISYDYTLGGNGITISSSPNLIVTQPLNTVSSSGLPSNSINQSILSTSQTSIKVSGTYNYLGGDILQAYLVTNEKDELSSLKGPAVWHEDEYKEFWINGEKIDVKSQRQFNKYKKLTAFK